MKFRVLLFSCLSLIATTIWAQKDNTFPVPHSISWGEEEIPIQKLNLVINKNNNADQDAYKLLHEFTLERQIKSKPYPITIGDITDKKFRRYSKQVPKKSEGYYLKIDSNGATVIGYDKRGTFYGVQTLLQILSRDRVYPVIIKDFPNVSDRGVVEGFYGTPWSFEDRLSLIDFFGKTKMNTYIYGPKDDPYHSSPNWRKAYPAEESKNIQKLVEASNQNKVQFVWAIHPGQDIKWNQEDRTNLLNKFNHMYDLGVRAFAVFFDDIIGEGTQAVKQAELLNYLHNNFVKVKGDVAPLIICPTEYNKSWSNPEGGYLRTLGEELDPSIRIMWTGDRVIADITEESMNWINNQIGRPAYIWWNYPVTDYVRDHILLGPVYGNEKNIFDMVSGFVSNPMEHAEASKIAIFSVADYVWNMPDYDEMKSWQNSLKFLMPISYKALSFMAKHNSDLGPNGHNYRRKESVDFKPLADKWLLSVENGTNLTRDEYNEIYNEYYKAVKCADFLLSSKDNPRFINETKQWIRMFSLVGQFGKEVVQMNLSLNSSDNESFLSHYYRARALQIDMYDLNANHNQNKYQPGIKSGETVLYNTASSIFNHLVLIFNDKYNSELNAQPEFLPFSIYTNKDEFKQQPLRQFRRDIMISPKLEYITLYPGEFVGVELDKSYILNNIQIAIGSENWNENLSLIVSDKENVFDNTISLVLGRDKKTFIQQTKDLIKGKYIYLINSGDTALDIKLDKFQFTPILPK